MKVHVRIKARAVGTAVQKTQHGQGHDILHAADKVTFTGNGNDGLRPEIAHDLPGQGAACSDGKVGASGLAQGQDGTDGTTAALMAIVYIPRNFMGTLIPLQAVRCQNQDLIRANAQMAPQNELIEVVNIGVGQALLPFFSRHDVAQEEKKEARIGP